MCFLIKWMVCWVELPQVFQSANNLKPLLTAFPSMPFHSHLAEGRLLSPFGSWDSEERTRPDGLPAHALHNAPLSPFGSKGPWKVQHYLWPTTSHPWHNPKIGTGQSGWWTFASCFIRALLEATTVGPAFKSGRARTQLW